jgi:hypothetical protein
MALDKTKFDPGAGSSSKGGAPKIATYQSSADEIATIEGSGYFNGIGNSGLKTGDLLFYSGTNGAKIAQVAVSAAGVVTLPLKVALA